MRATGIETEAAALDGTDRRGGGRGDALALDALMRPDGGCCGGRLLAVLEEAPDWLDGPARARIEGAAGAGCMLRARMISACVDRAARANRRRARSGLRRLARGRSHRGPRVRYRHPPPLARSRRGRSRRGGAGARAGRAGDLGDADAAPARRHGTSAPTIALGRARTSIPRSHHFAAVSPFDYGTAAAEVLIVTDIKRGDHSAARATPMPGWSRRRVAARSGCSPRSQRLKRGTMRGSPTGSRARGCRSTRSMSTRSTPAR